MDTIKFMIFLTLFTVPLYVSGACLVEFALVKGSMESFVNSGEINAKDGDKLFRDMDKFIEKIAQENLVAKELTRDKILRQLDKMVDKGDLSESTGEDLSNQVQAMCP